MSSECEKLIDWIMSYFDPHWESLGPEKRDEILVKAKQLFQAAIREELKKDADVSWRAIEVTNGRLKALEQKVEALEKQIAPIVEYFRAEAHDIQKRRDRK